MSQAELLNLVENLKTKLNDVVFNEGEVGAVKSHQLGKILREKEL